METPAQIGPFSVRRVLGTGAAGSVFLCDHPRLGLPVAVKVLHDQDPDVLARFQREAELTSRIKHPNVVEVFEAGSSPEGPYLVLEFCSGEDLASALKSRGALPPAEAARLVAQLARGVEAAHQVGVVHRDLKPQNVLVTDRGPKVTDFGVAREERESALEALTQSGVILGTPSYMAPEQAKSARGADERSDVYALGVILYECVAGRQPFPGNTTLEVLNRVVEGAADPLPAETPKGLAQVVQCAMSVDPAGRFSSAAFLAEALEGLDFGPAPRSTPVLGVAIAGFALGALVVGVAFARGALGVSAASPGASEIESPKDTRGGEPGPSSPPRSPPRSTPRSTPTPTPRLAGAYRSEGYFLEKQRAWRLPRVTQLEILAAQGNSAASLAMGLRYQGGLGGVRQSRARAIEIFEGLAAKGNADGMTGLGLLLGREGRARRSQELLQEARSLGSHDAAWILAVSAEDRSAAVEAARVNAKLGDPSAIYFLADRAFARGDGEETLAWCGRAVELGLPKGFSIRARLERVQPESDAAQVAADYRRGAAGEDAEGLCGFARCLILGEGVPRDLEAAQVYLDRALEARPVWVRFERVLYFAAKGDRRAWLAEVAGLLDLGERDASPDLWGWLGLHVSSQRNSWRGALVASAKFLSRSKPYLSLNPKVPFRTGLAIQAKQIPVSRDPVEAAALLYERSAKLGHPEARYAYGHALVYGRGVPRDVKLGLAMVEAAAEEGVALAWGRLGDLYHQGLQGQIEVDRVRARAFYRRGAEGRDPNSCFKYSAMLLRGEDLEEGARWAKQAAELGSVPGAISYANCLLKGRGVEADAAKALPVLVRLSKREPVACDVLAQAYQDGVGVEVDSEKAASYAAQADALRRAKRGY